VRADHFDDDARIYLTLRHVGDSEKTYTIWRVEMIGLTAVFAGPEGEQAVRCRFCSPSITSRFAAWGGDHQGKTRHPFLVSPTKQTNSSGLDLA
jgi:hypothetical protein